MVNAFLDAALQDRLQNLVGDFLEGSDAEKIAAGVKLTNILRVLGIIDLHTSDPVTGIWK